MQLLSERRQEQKERECILSASSLLIKGQRITRSSIWVKEDNPLGAGCCETFVGINFFISKTFQIFEVK